MKSPTIVRSGILCDIPYKANCKKRFKKVTFYIKFENFEVALINK